MADFRLDLKKGDGVGTLAVEGYINNEGGEEITAACDQCIEEGIKDFVINLEQCKIVNSMEGQGSQRSRRLLQCGANDGQDLQDHGTFASL